MNAVVQGDSQMEEKAVENIIIEQIDCTPYNDLIAEPKNDIPPDSPVADVEAPGPSSTALSDCLNIPPVPRRDKQRVYKSRRFHVLTSDEFVEEFQQKEEDRKRLEEEKANRKAARMQKKQAAELKKKQTKEKKENKPPVLKRQKKN